MPRRILSGALASWRIDGPCAVESKTQHDVERAERFHPDHDPPLSLDLWNCITCNSDRSLRMANAVPHYVWAAGHFVLLAASLRYLFGWMTFHASGLGFYYKSKHSVCSYFELNLIVLSHPF